ncbi:acyltransferase family protein [Micromonospora soli]|uniref:acyltransferase family protein n=1 Tax=Micromonospora sp. NBRC 110009 TaxID=3061627 RepID=UPI00267144E7|nr:acyltransferase family protein [Micromonospora sp. NBRC 110009]WKU00319.1 acyltransferase family protein [Micromonospora sp. NBRC 110009]
MTTTVLPESPGVAVAPVSRDPYIDNVKGLLIVLVVLGHLVGQTVGSSPGGRTIYTFIYLCHMPAFVLLSGMLSATELTGRRAASLIRDLLAPYVVFQLLYMGFYTVMDKPMPWTIDELLSPIYHLWFLPALFIWRMLAPLFAQLRGAVVIAVVVSLSAGAATVLGHALSLDRVAGMLPFFVLGVWLGRGRLARRPSPRVRLTATAVLIAAAPVAYLVASRLPSLWLYWNRGYQRLGVEVTEGVLIRLGLMAVGLAMTWAIMMLAPRRQTFLTGWGANSIYPYLLHVFVVMAFAWSPLNNQVDNLPALLVLVAAAVALVWITASRPVVWALRPLVSPPVGWLLRDVVPAKKPQSTTGTSQS